MIRQNSVLTRGFWNGKRVFLTGNTGFKGSWLMLLLQRLGAEVIGYALTPNTEPNLFGGLGLGTCNQQYFADIRDRMSLANAISRSDPDVMIHMAAQALVSEGYEKPAETFETNVIGTVNVLEACRSLRRRVSLLVVSSDKCYLSEGANRPMREDDRLGGYDPYSASKAGTEIVTCAYRHSFFNEKGGPQLASARAGNVVGGGDWSLNRLIPDAARAFSQKQPLIVRNPLASRPWQFVLEPLYGYLLLIEKLSVNPDFACEWNFGPIPPSGVAVHEIADLVCRAWGDGVYWKSSSDEQEWKEAATLLLDSSEAYRRLGWHPVWDIKDTIANTITWYKSFYSSADARNILDITLTQIDDYCERQNG
jgi:CDP-glucose 4,6-dehydratase